MKITTRTPALLLSLLSSSCLLLFRQPVAAAPFNSSLDRSSTGSQPPLPLLDRRQSGLILITGVTAGPVRPRLDIRDLRNNVDQWNIFLLGLARFQERDQDDPLSYYQIAGIHGRPAIPWNEVSGVANPAFPGYCTHSSNVFITWHRPYLALFEQVLVANALEVARQFPAGADRDRYVRAAESLRMPYLDWAAPPPDGQNVIPDFLVQPEIGVISPDDPGRASTIRNPLYSYRFRPAANANPDDPNQLFFRPWSQMRETVRAPSRRDDPTATSQDAVVVRNFNAARTSLRSRLYTLLSQYDSYQAFSSSANAQPGTRADSLESLHDNVHGFIGYGQGHMSILDFAAFDPIFWLHHVMVDRASALWQVINPNSYVQPLAQPGGTYWANRGDVLDVNSALRPFRSPRGGFWTSRDVRTTEVFNYNYPGITRRTSASAARRLVNELYGGSVAQLSRRLSHDIGPISRIGGGGDSDQKDGEGIQEYLVTLVAPRGVLPGSYYIYLFLGEPDEDPDNWIASPNLVGMQSVMSMLGGHHANNSTDMNVAPGRLNGTDPATVDSSKAGSMVTGSTISLNDKMAEMGDAPELAGLLQTTAGSSLFSSVNEPAITAYLEKRLEWRVLDSAGAAVAPADLPGLEIGVVSQRVEAARSSDSFPTWTGRSRFLPSVTRNKAAGLGSDRRAKQPENVRPVIPVSAWPKSAGSG